MFPVLFSELCLGFPQKETAREMNDLNIADTINLYPANVENRVSS
jgi:hypothetical protein